MKKYSKRTDVTVLNRPSSGSKANGKKGRRSRRAKRNDGNMGMKFLKIGGCLLASSLLAVGGAMLIAKTDYSLAAQDGILAAGGFVIGGAMFALAPEKYDLLSMALLAAPVAVAATRATIRWRAGARVAALVDAALGNQQGNQQAAAQQGAASQGAASQGAANASAGYPSLTAGPPSFVPMFNPTPAEATNHW